MTLSRTPVFYPYAPYFKDHAHHTDVVLFQPPHTTAGISRMARELTGGPRNQNEYMKALKLEVQRHFAPGTLVLSFGFHTAGLGQKYGGETVEIMTVACKDGVDISCKVERITEVHAAKTVKRKR